MARWTILSSSAAMPSSRCRPSAFGMYALRVGFARYAPVLHSRCPRLESAPRGLRDSGHRAFARRSPRILRSGTSNCHVRLSTKPIDSPLVSVPNMLLALNEPSLRKFIGAVQPGGWALYNGEEFPEDCARPDVHTMALPFTRIADEVGAAKAGNIVMLGALVEATGMLSQEQVTAALRKLVKSQRWMEIDLAALARGREEARKGLPHEN